jgi:disulfide bond formation protein DsbB
MRATHFSFAGLGNLLALLAVNGALSYAFFDQLYLGEPPCPLCLLQRVAYILIGIALVLNIRFGAHGAHYGWGILGAVAGMAVSLRHILLHVLPGDTGYGNTFLELHFYTWAFVGFISLIAAQAILMMLPSGGVRNHGGLAKALVIWFIILVLANVISTLLECGIGPCADDPVNYDGLQWLRQRFGI